MKRIWNRLFLQERPSINLSLFRIAVALTTGFHVLPSFFHLADNYFSTAFKTYNTNFFTIGVIDFVQKSPDWLVSVWVGIFCVAWFLFLIGFLGQLSCVVMTAACYYFYALNSFHVGTLSWDILLVTLFLMSITGYHSDYFSIDCLRRKNEGAFQVLRPYFVQRLLQLQIGFTFFYTAVYKVTVSGNWLKDNPIYYLMNYPHAGVTKFFLLRDFLMDKPDLCYAIGILIVVVELLMIGLLFYPRTRISAIYLGVFFHILLILTLDVPAIFFFLFPAQLLLFVDSKKTLAWIEQKRKLNAVGPQVQLIFDGRCQFCVASVKVLKIMDLYGVMEVVDFHSYKNIAELHPKLTKEMVSSQLYLIETNGRLHGGFFVFRKICFMMPMLYPFIPILYFPGMSVVGSIFYKFVAKNRYLIHINPTCSNNSCFR